MSLIGGITIGGVVLLLVGGAVYFVSRYVRTLQTGEEAQANLAATQAHIAAQEAADAAARAAREKAFDAKATAVRDATAAADLLRSAGPGSTGA